MLVTRDRELRWVRGLKYEDRHVRRVLGYARKIFGAEVGGQRRRERRMLEVPVSMKGERGVNLSG